MPQEDNKNRRPPRWLNLAEQHIQKHLPDTPQMLKQLKEDGKAHIFNDRATLFEVTEALFENGEFIGTVRGHERYGMYFAEMKIIKGEYHVIPRTKPSEVI